MYHSFTVETAIRVFHYFKMMGFSPVTIIDGKSVTTLIDIFYFLTSILFGIFFCFVAILKKDDLVSSVSSIADTGNILTFIMAMVISIITMLIAFVWRHRNYQMTLMLGVVEEKVSDVNARITFQSQSKLNVYFLSTNSSIASDIMMITRNQLQALILLL